MMNRFVTAGAACLLAAGTVHAGLISPVLDEVLRQAAPDEVVSTLIYLHEQVDAEALTRALNREAANLQTRHAAVVRELQGVARETQGDLVGLLEGLQAEGRVDDFHAYWIGNLIRVDATPEEIRFIAEHRDIEYVYWNYPIESIKPVDDVVPVAGDPTDGGPEPGLVAIRAPEVWDLGITGGGVLVATLDTGVDGTHPALASRWRGLDPRYADNPEWAWFDPVTNTKFPQAFGSHGTHTMGSVCGGAPGEQVGVAPGAVWMHAAVIDRKSISRTVADAILSFEWMAEPDGDPDTSWDIPVVCSNSWGLVTAHGYPPCDETFWSFLDASEAAGTLQTFSAGNEGASGLRRPADRATDDYRTMAVAAVNANIPGWPI